MHEINIITERIHGKANRPEEVDWERMFISGLTSYSILHSCYHNKESEEKKITPMFKLFNAIVSYCYLFLDTD